MDNFTPKRGSRIVKRTGKEDTHSWKVLLGCNILFDIGFLFASFSLRSTSRLIIASHRKTTVHLENNIRKPQSIRLAALVKQLHSYHWVSRSFVNTYLRQLISHFRSSKVKTGKETFIFHIFLFYSSRIVHRNNPNLDASAHRIPKNLWYKNFFVSRNMPKLRFDSLIYKCIPVIKMIIV